MSLEKTDGYKNGNHFADEVMSALKEAEISVDENLALSFFLYLPSRESAIEACKIIEKKGFQVDVEESADKESEDWLCWCNKTFIPNKENLIATGNLFLGLSSELNGNFDGWETDPYADASSLTELLSQLKQSQE